MAIDPSRSVPDDVATVQSLQSMTEESAKAAMTDPTRVAMAGAQGVFGGVLSGLINGIANAIRGIFDPFGMFGAIGSAMEPIRDGQLALEDRTDLLSPLLDYGSCFAHPTNRLHGTGFVVFTEQLGPVRGCAVIKDTQGGIRLLEAGLWDIRLQVSADKVLSATNNTFRFELRVYDPRDGSIFSVQRFHLDDGDVITGTIVSSVVVPEPNFRVRCYVTTMNANRGVLGGPAWTRLAVQHISREVDGAWGTGGEGSTPETTE